MMFLHFPTVHMAHFNVSIEVATCNTTAFEVLSYKRNRLLFARLQNNHSAGHLKNFTNSLLRCSCIAHSAIF